MLDLVICSRNRGRHAGPRELKSKLKSQLAQGTSVAGYSCGLTSGEPHTVHMANF